MCVCVCAIFVTDFFAVINTDVKRTKKLTISVFAPHVKWCQKLGKRMKQRRINILFDMLAYFIFNI